MVDAEYGNQGVDFKFVAREGFGWTKCVSGWLVRFKLSHKADIEATSHGSSSFQVGLSFLK